MSQMCNLHAFRGFYLFPFTPCLLNTFSLLDLLHCRIFQPFNYGLFQSPRLNAIQKCGPHNVCIIILFSIMTIHCNNSLLYPSGVSSRSNDIIDLNKVRANSIRLIVSRSVAMLSIIQKPTFSILLNGCICLPLGFKTLVPFLVLLRIIHFFPSV